MRGWLCILAFLLATSCAADNPRIFYLNSYHEGYGSSDDIMQGIFEVIDTTAIDLEIFFLDAKRVPKHILEQNAQKAWDAILLHKPDVIISSDDNAMESVIVPNLDEIVVPVLYCGINWSDKSYHLPKEKVTGMLEVLPVETSLDFLKRSGVQPTSITVISEQSTGEYKNKEALIPFFTSKKLSVTYLMVETFEEWKAEFLNAQSAGNVLFIPTNGGIKGWNNSVAEQFVRDNIAIPVFTCDDFMMPFACFGFTKIAKEQGEWVGKKALEILDHKSVAEIQRTQNSQYDCFINKHLFEKIGLDEKEINKMCKNYNYVE